MRPLPGTLPEPEIHARLLEAVDPFETAELELLKRAASQGLEAFTAAFHEAATNNVKINLYTTYVLYRTLGPRLPKGMAESASLWGVAHLFAKTEGKSLASAGFDGPAPIAANKLFTAFLESQSGLVFSVDDYEASYRRNRLPNGLVNPAVPEMLDKFKALSSYESAETTEEFPMVLAAGERRSYTANTVIRDPASAKSNNAYTLSVNPTDAANLGINDGGRARLTTAKNSIEVVVEIDKRMMAGHISLPNGFGLSYPDANGRAVITGVSPNELTAAEDCDDFAYTPWHKFVLARLDAVTQN